MKPKLLHQEAMSYSFKAKQALEKDNYASAFHLFTKAADLESQVAEFYFDKPELEPTRSIIIRSAAYLNIKAGQIQQAKKFIFFGLLNTTDSLINEQLNNALEVAVSLGNLNPDVTSREFNYLNLLRQKSVHYIIEPSHQIFGRSVSLESIKDFSDSYLKSLKAFAVSKYKRVLEVKEELEQSVVTEIERSINPLITSSAYGSFKFSIANDCLSRQGDKKEFLEIKENVVAKYHKEIFINPLTDKDIEMIKEKYTAEEVNDIFRPLTKIKSNNAPYNVGYYDTEQFDKKFVSKIVNKQKRQLITTKQITQDDIGELESSLIHKRSGKGGRTSNQVIFKQQMKTAEFDISILELMPKEVNSIPLAEAIIVSVNFDSQKGFTIAFADLNIIYTDTAYQKALEGFHNKFYIYLKDLANANNEDFSKQKDIKVANRFINNLKALAD